ncbi:unnamed protein product [Thlaspi arvense]|uniref:Phytocyanin domain-containing protein n=1 Tax=Thlaspi arvense TaxID=13288 RepID=A0AAU9SLL9_THLAR|nr:unnamed protein product [Thlaspi arvense]
MARSSGQVSHVAATIPMAIVMAIFCIFLANNVTHARRPTTYNVGDKNGWDTNTVISMDTWARGKTFYAGDILVFRYDNKISNLVVVNQPGYETCTANSGSRVYNSGNDRIQLPYGRSYYIGTKKPTDCSDDDFRTLDCCIEVFRYDYQLVNMLVVNRTGYETCIPNEGYEEYNTGEDEIQLIYGGNYFIGTDNSVDCSAGMKLAINALSPDLNCP